MQLILSSTSVRNAIFVHETGQVLYKTTHPHSIGMGTTTLYKVKPNDDPTDMRDQFDAIGEINWRLIGSSTFRLHDRSMQSNEFLPAHGILGRFMRSLWLYFLRLTFIQETHVHQPRWVPV